MEQALAIILRRDGDHGAKRRAWVEVLAAGEASGLTVTAFCRRHGICPKRFFRWRGRLAAAASCSPALPPLLEVSGSDMGEAGRIEIVLGSARVLLPEGLPLARVLAAVKEAAC